MNLIGQRLQCRPDDVTLIDAPCDADDGASCILIPVRSAKTGKGRNHITAVCIRHFLRHIFRVRRRINQPHLIPKPLDRSPRHENRSFQGVLHLTVHSPGNGRNKSVFRKYRGLPRIHQQKTACPVRVLCFSRRKAGLSKKRRLLIPCRSSNRNFPAKICRGRRSVNTARRPDFRKHTFRNV